MPTTNKSFAIRWHCSICLTDKSNGAKSKGLLRSQPCILDGCGAGKHVFCESCISLTKEKKCPTCCQAFEHIIPIQIVPGSEPIDEMKLSRPRRLFDRLPHLLRWAWDCEKGERFYSVLTMLAFLVFCYVLHMSTHIRGWLAQRLPEQLVTFGMGLLFAVTAFAFLMMLAPEHNESINSVLLRKKRINTIGI